MSFHPRHSIEALRALLLTLVLSGLGLPGSAAGQAPPPDEEWRTFRTAHFRITYGPGLESLADRAAVAAERTHAILRDELGEPPGDIIDILVTDHVDYSNGLATIFPSSRITVYARPPTAMPQLAWSGDWIELVIAHELVHVFHLAESGGVGHLVRGIFGRIPMIWPVFPVIGSPTWNVEGLATYYESRLTGSGRVPGSFHEMIIRTAALEDQLPDLDELSAPNPVWPGGQKSYGYGSRLMDHIAERYGPDAHRRIVEATGSSILPTFLAFDHVARRAVGEPFDVVYENWRRETRQAVRRLADSLTALGLTPTTPVAGRGPYAAQPRLSPDGRYLSFAADDYRSSPSTRVLDLATGRVRGLADRNQFGALLGPASWLPDGKAMILAQLERHGPYRAVSDLWRIDVRGREQRLTHGERLAQPDVARDGRRVVAVQARAGRAELVAHDLETGETRVLLGAEPGHAFDSPRWSPDARHVAVARDSGGRVDIVIVDVASGAVTPLTRDDALDLSPAWSPDGAWVLWWSDRTGVPNIMAAPAAASPAASPADAPEPDPTVYQVTNLLTGGFQPEVGPEGETLYLSVYHHDGWQIETTPFDPDSWRPAPPNVMRHGTGLLASEPGMPPEGGPQGSAPYRPWSTLAPSYWLPDWEAVGGGDAALNFLGLRTGGRDLVSRHEWTLGLGVDRGTGRVRGDVGWLYRGLVPADLHLSGGRRWRFAGPLSVSDGTETVWERVDRASAAAVLWRNRWRSVGWLRLGTALERSSLEAHTMSTAELEAEGRRLRSPRTRLGLTAGSGYSNARVFPLSIGPQDGVSGSLTGSRWWRVQPGEYAYDEVVGRLAAYRALPLGGFAHHVLAGRVAGLVVLGPSAPLRSIGGLAGPGIPAAAAELLGGGLPGPGALPVRGYSVGERSGTRAWVGSAEWRFPLHLRNAPPGRVLGFSLTALSGSIFTDFGDAWCPGPMSDDEGCSAPDDPPIASAGTELTVDFGLFHNQRALLRVGVARPLVGTADDPTVYLALGRSF